MQRLAKSQSLSYGETEAKHARICSATRRQQNPNRLKKILRHAKARQVSEPVLWRDRSQACQDLLGHEKAAESKSFEENPRHAKAHRVSKPALWRDRSQACQDLLGHEKAAESQSSKNPRRAKAHRVSKPVLWRDRSQAWRDLLDRVKASRIPNIGKFSKAGGETIYQAIASSTRRGRAGSRNYHTRE